MKFLFFIFFPIFSFSQVELDTITVINGRVKLLAPKEFKQMDNEIWELKYGKKQKPELVLTDNNAELNLIIDYKQQQPATDAQIPQLREFQIKQLAKNRPDFELLEKGEKKINGKTVGFFKFLTQATDQKIFNYYFFTSLDNKILFFSFNCIQKLMSKWEKEADKILQSLIFIK